MERGLRGVAVLCWADGAGDLQADANDGGEDEDAAEPVLWWGQ